MQFNFDAATVIPIDGCAIPIAHTGATFGSAEDDSEGCAMVLGSEGNFFAAYATQTGRFVIDFTVSYAALWQANDAAERFTRAACTNDPAKPTE